MERLLRALLACAAVMSAACDHEAQPPSAPSPPAETAPAESRQPDVTIRLRATALGGADAAAGQQAIADAFARVGVAARDDGATAPDADVLLTVTAMPLVEGSPSRRTTLMLSTSVGQHEMEDISAHFVGSDGAIDPVSARELCQRWRRRYQRYQSAMGSEERVRP